MGYLHIENLYKNKDILLFKRCYAMNKIHGSSANLTSKDGELTLFSGGESAVRFQQIFKLDELKQRMAALSKDIIIYGEVYGSGCQKMGHVYGPQLRFAAFDVQIDGLFLAVPQAEEVVKSLGLDFVDYEEVSTDLDELNRVRDSDDPQAIKNGMGKGHKREGIVLRPLIEVTKNNGSRIICKHKRDDFKETATPRVVSDAELAVLADAKAIADEWVTEMRMQHVLDKIEQPSLSKMAIILRAIIEDVKREGEGEIVWSKEAEKAVTTKGAQVAKKLLTQL